MSEVGREVKSRGQECPRSTKSKATDQRHILAAEAGPVFGDDDGVAGIVWVVLDAGWEAESAGVEIGELAQPGYVL